MGFSRWWIGFKAMNVKNYVWRKRHWVQTLFEITVPLFIILILACIRPAVHKKSYAESLNEDKSAYLLDARPIQAYMWYQHHQSLLPNTSSLADEASVLPRMASLALIMNRTVEWDFRVGIVAPDTLTVNNRSLYEDFSEYMVNTYSLVVPDLSSRIIRFARNKDVDTYCKRDDYISAQTRPLLFAVVFESVGEEWRYVIRMNASDTQAKYKQVPDTWLPEKIAIQITYAGEQWGYYFQQGFLALQSFVDDYILLRRMQAVLPQTDPDTVLNHMTHVWPFPTPFYNEDPLLTNLAGMISFFFVFAYMWPVAKIINQLVGEKETRTKELFQTMGLYPSVLTAAWLLNYSIIYILSSILMAVATWPVYQYSNKLLIALFFFSFSLAMFAYAYLLQCLFNRSGIATFVGCVGMLVLFFVALFIKEDTSGSTITVLCLDFLVAFGMGLFELTSFESGQSGITYSNWNDGLLNFSLLNANIMLLVDFAWMMMLGLYLERVLPQTYGVRERWYFFCSPAYWRGSRNKHGKQEEMNTMDERVPLGADYKTGVAVEARDEASQARIAIRMRDLRKVWNKGSPRQVIAVNDLNMDVAEGEIFVLLGHNGAGKSTTVNIITGMYTPTSGDCIVYGKSIREDLSAIRQQLGVCHQQNIIYDELTVTEHLQLYGAIKNMPSAQLAVQIPEIIQQVGLSEKTNSPAGTLSGGQKRRLSLAMALVGDSKVVFLDEPTSGMDPYSRRMTWDLLKKKKEGRVIILTTHFMDEADQLGDRIAIMAKGELRCVGSSLFLKKRYGVGYTFTINKEKNFDEAAATALITQYVEHAERISNIAGELSFRLPFDSCSRFPELFDKLDASKAKLGIEAYSISVTTLEEVFLRVARDEEDLNQLLETQVSKHNISLQRQLSKLQGKQASKRRLDLKNTDHETKSGAHAGDEEQKSESHTHAHTDTTTEKKAGVRTDITAAQKQEEDAKAREQEINAIEKELKRMGSEQAIQAAEHPDDLAIKTVPPTVLKHIRALVTKRWHNSRRDKGSWAWTLLYPLLVILAFLFMVKSALPNIATSKTLDPRIYNLPAYTPYNSESSTDQIFAGAGNIYPANELQPVKYLGTNSSQQFARRLLDSVTDLRSGYDFKQSKFGAFYLQQNREPLFQDPLSFPTVFFNTTGYHSLPTFFNILSNFRANAYLRALGSDQRIKISIANKPLPLSAAESSLNDSTIVLAIMAGYAFVLACYAFFIVKERETGAKHQQQLSGVGIFAYWFSSFIWDFINFLPVLVCTMILLVLFDVQQLVSGSAFWCTVATCLMYVLAGTPFTYLVTFLFKEASSAQNVILMICIVTGCIFNIAAIVLNAIESTSSIGDIIRWPFRLFPSFCLGEILSGLIVRRVAAFFDGKQKDAWDFELVGKSFIFLAWTSVFYFALVLVCERALATPEVVKKLSIADNAVVDEEYEEDADVAAEERRVAEGGADKEMMKICKLRKVYPSRMGVAPKVALKGLSLGIPEGECFGLLGINGAGKTTAISCLTGFQIPSSGTAYMRGLDIMTQQPEIRSLLGYCPQFDALFDKMTGREHLYFYGRLKGIPEDLLGPYVTKMIHKMGLDAHADKPTEAYSGGNKRKLSVGIALMGNPCIIFLDEPSTGMDPNARRFMWGVIASTMAGRSVILTTHNMEECEALCQRIGILVSGRLRCLGNATHLKTTHGAGYQLDVNLPMIMVPALKDFLNVTFPGVKLIEHHEGNLKYRIPPGSSLGGIFRAIETQVKRLQISEYAVSETTLEQIFLHFAKQQDEDQQEVAGLDEEEDNTNDREKNKAENKEDGRKGGQKEEKYGVKQSKEGKEEAEPLCGEENSGGPTSGSDNVTVNVSDPVSEEHGGAGPGR